MSSGSRNDLARGRLTMSCWTIKSSAVRVKSETLPSLVPFLVSTLRLMRLKLRSRILLILTTSSFSTSSSMESMTQPYLLYSRTDL